MKRFLHSRDNTSKGAALIIVLALVVLATAVSLAYLTRTTTDRQLAQSSYNDTSADLLARSALDITVSDLKQEILTNPVDQNHIQPLRYGVPPITDPLPIPNLIRRSFSGDPTGRTSIVRSDLAAANGRIISLARWNSHYLVPKANTSNSIDSTPVSSFTAPYWVLVTAQGPTSAPPPNAVIGRYAFAIYDEGGLMDMNVGGYPNYANLTRPTRPLRKLRATYPEDESEIMLAACQAPNFTPQVTNVTLATGQPCSLLFGTNHNPYYFDVSSLPHGLTINHDNGNIYGTPTGPGQWTITLSCLNACGSGTGTLNLTILGFPSPNTTPWPVNVARKGTVGFADLTTLPSLPPVITPTTPVGDMGNFLPGAQIDKLAGWRNYATTQQTGSFYSPSFPLATADNYAQYFLGQKAPFVTPFTTVPTTVLNNRTDQAMMTRQELIKLQRTLCTDPVTGSYDDTKFPQSLLQYLGTFSREFNRPAPSWPGLVGSLAGARWDMNNLQILIPTPWWYPGNHGQGHAYGKQRAENGDLARFFNVVWVPGTFADGTRFTDPNYYGHWRYMIENHGVDTLPVNGDPADFFQVINFALKQKNGGVSDPAAVFNIGAAIIDQYDTDDLHDSPPAGSDTGNTITIIDYLNNGNALAYAYGIESMSYDDPNGNLDRPPFAPYPPANYVLLNRRFENVGEFGYARKPPNAIVDFAPSTSVNDYDTALLDFFTYNWAGNRAGIVNLNTRNGPVLASIIRGAWLHDLGFENPPNPATDLVLRTDALAAGQAIIQETTNNTAGHGPALTRADVGRLAAAAAAAVSTFTGSPEKRQTIARALAEVGQARTWNLMIDVIAQTGNYAPGTADLSDPSKFIVQGEKRYWLHIALDRDSGAVLGSQLEEVFE